jgi:hypothetical protein
MSHELASTGGGGFPNVASPNGSLAITGSGTANITVEGTPCGIQYGEQGFASPAVTTGTQGGFNFVFTPISPVLTFVTPCPVLAQVDVRAYVGMQSSTAGAFLQTAHSVVQFRINGGAWAQSDDSLVSQNGPVAGFNDAGPNVTGSFFLPAGTHTFEARGGVANIVNQDGLAEIRIDTGRITVTFFPSLPLIDP